MHHGTGKLRSFFVPGFSYQGHFKYVLTAAVTINHTSEKGGAHSTALALPPRLPGRLGQELLTSFCSSSDEVRSPPPLACPRPKQHGRTSFKCHTGWRSFVHVFKKRERPRAPRV